MARGHQKAQSQAKNQEKQKALKNKQGHSKDTQNKAALQALKLQCTICRGLMPDPKTYRQHFENKHPSSPLPQELKDVAVWRVSSNGRHLVASSKMAESRHHSKWIIIFPHPSYLWMIVDFISHLFLHDVGEYKIVLLVIELYVLMFFYA